MRESKKQRKDANQARKRRTDVRCQAVVRGRGQPKRPARGETCKVEKGENEAHDGDRNHIFRHGGLGDSYSNKLSILVKLTSSTTHQCLPQRLLQKRQQLERRLPWLNLYQTEPAVHFNSNHSPKKEILPRSTWANEGTAEALCLYVSSSRPS
jgi:hypothetical protein